MNVVRWSESDIQCCLKQQSEKIRKAKKEAKAVEVQLPTRGKDGKFVRGPIPLDWIEAAIPCGRKSVKSFWRSGFWLDSVEPIRSC